MTKMLKDLKQNLKDGKMLKRVQHDTRVRRALAFTLAEVLIVIGIIGVVAALTLPNLNHATGDKETVARVKKIYSALTEAFDRAQAIYGPVDEWCDWYTYEKGDCTQIASIRITEFMKVSKECKYNPDDGCWSQNDLLNIYGQSYGEKSQGYYGYSFLLSDNTTLSFLDNGYIRVTVDIDGPNKGKTQVGKDIFEFAICYEEGWTLCGNVSNQLLTINNHGDPNYISSYPTAWIIMFDNMDYLKCPDELNWETKTSCE